MVVLYTEGISKKSKVSEIVTSLDMSFE